MQKIRNFHIMQLVGSHFQNHNLSILLYSVAEYNLQEFHWNTSELQNNYSLRESRLRFLASALSCLASASMFIHGKKMTHMDVKPLDIMVNRDPEEDLL